MMLPRTVPLLCAIAMFLSMETALGFVSSPNKASVAKVPVSVSSTTMAVSETGSAKKTGPKGSNKKKASSSKKAAVPKGSNKKKANSSKKAAVPKKKQGGGSRKEKAKQFMVRRWASQQASKKKQAAPKQSEEFMSVVGLSTNDIKAERGKKKSPIRKTIKKRTTKEGNKQQEKGLLSWTDLKPGSKIPVTVIKLLPYGALVKTQYDIPGKTKGCAMLHISQIAEEKIENISDVLKVGQKIDDARVVNLNRELGKVSVSLRAETKRAIPLVSLNVGDEVQGKIVRLKQYGAFIDVGCKRNALLHISRMSIHKVDAITDFANVGETVNVRVIRVDSDNKNIAVSMLSPESDKFVDRRDRQRERMTVWQQVVDAGEDDDLDNLISELLNLDRVIHDEFFESLGNPRTLEV